ncbi:GGDEF domain-containing protein [Chitinimonas sp. BJYL2]|uniref:sensor domain-containing diguanylate cyclase n=1 Tax=Chitinimonas sp. BJYL2 TaxID=2976696 RepID=UPI0022B40AAC|nr:GGDEF domain-containing protein [Chitinimonas sp. BJYL2]
MPKPDPDLQSLAIELESLRAVLDEIGAYVFTKDLDGRYTYVNRRVLELFGVTRDQVLGKDDRDFFDLDLSQQLRQNDLRVMQTGEVTESEETNVIRATGETRVYWSIKKPMRDAEGHIIGLCGISSDITEHKRLENQVREQKVLLDTILDNIDAYVYMKDVNRTCLYANQKLADLYGHPVERMIGRTDGELLSREIADSFWALDQKVFSTGQRHVGEESFTDRKGRVRHYWTIKVPWPTASGLPGLIGFSTDITELHELKEELERQASTDSLTGIANRRSFYEHAEREYTRSRRHAFPLSVIAIDVDHFKRINDEYGHPVGDAVLQDVAACCRIALRNEDMLGRTGGEEFAILLPSTPSTTAMEVAERMRQLIASREVSAAFPELRISASFGVASLVDTDQRFDTLFSRADHALYEAKLQGRNRVALRA